MVSRFEERPAPKVDPGSVTLLGQAFILRGLVPSMTMPSDGATAARVFVEFTPELAEKVIQIAERLERLSSFEGAIRKLVARG